MSGRKLSALVVTIVVGLGSVALIASVCALIAEPGRSLDQQDQMLIGSQILEHESHSSDERSPSKFTGPQVIPENVFRAVSEGHNLPVLFFCIVMGIALGSLSSQSSEPVLAFVEATYNAMLKLIHWLMYALPLGLFCLFSAQVSKLGGGVLLALIDFVCLALFVCMLLMTIYIGIIWIKTRQSLLTVIIALKHSIIISLGTSSSMAAMPSTIEAMSDNLGFDRETANLVIPLGFTINPQGNVAVFSLMLVFMLQLYNIPIHPADVLSILVLSVLSGVAASTAPGIAGLTMLAIAFKPFNLPVDIGIFLLSAIDPVIDPLFTAVNVTGNAATTALVSPRSSAQRS